MAFPDAANSFKDVPVSGLGVGTLCPARPRGGVMPMESNGRRYPSAAIFIVEVIAGLSTNVFLPLSDVTT